MHTSPNATSNTFVNEVVRIATAELGIHETSHNASPRINEYLRAVHLPPGNPWCVAFMFWVYQQASQNLHVANPMPLTGSGHKLWQKTPTWRRISIFSLVRPGCVWLADHGEGKSHGGIVVSPIDTTAKRNSFTAIEGNTNEQGSREGIAVKMQPRAASEATLGFLDFSFVVAA